MTAAAGAISVGAQTIVIVLAGIVVVCMAACAIRLVAWRRPVDRFRICLVASSAGEIAAMVKGFVEEPPMPECVRYPRKRFVTDIALLLRDEVID